MPTRDDEPIELTPAPRARPAKPRPIPVGWDELPGEEPTPPPAQDKKQAAKSKPADSYDSQPVLGGRRWAGAGPLPGGRAWDVFLVALVLVAGVTGLGLATGTGVKVPPQFRQPGLVVASCTFAIALLGLAVRLRRGRWVEVAAFEHGLVYIVRGREATVRWQDVAAVTERRVTILNERGLPGGYRHFILFRCHDGVEHRLEVGGIDDADRLSECLHAGTLPHLMPKVVEAVTSGRRATFGRLAVTPDGLVHGRRLLPWDEMGTIDIVNGVLVVRCRGDEDPWYAEDCGATPNLQVLLNLVRTRFLTPEQEAARRNKLADESRYSVLDKYMPSVGGRRIGY